MCMCPCCVERKYKKLKKRIKCIESQMKEMKHTLDLTLSNTRHIIHHLHKDDKEIAKATQDLKSSTDTLQNSVNAQTPPAPVTPVEPTPVAPVV